jgi:serine-type D-Ala-D-Ala carboxypeptidase (penicillin-binding protein 5/6)
VMRRALLAAVVLAVALAAPVHASYEQAPDARDLEVAAGAWYLVGEDGTVLAQQDAHRQRAIASITKIMTALVALERSRPSDVVSVSPAAAGLGGSTIYLRPGEQLTVETLVRGMLIPSANDAAAALAIHVGGSTDRFVSLMNAKARGLGLRDTQFRNPHGLDEAGHVSSARDATLLVREALRRPLVREALSQRTFSLGVGREFVTTNDLLSSWRPLLAGKTGHTAAAGWSEAAAARGNGTTVYGTVLGSASRAVRNDALESLLRAGIASYRRVAAIESARVYAEVETGYGKAAARLVPRRPIATTVLAGRPLVEKVVAPTSVELPVRKGQRFGRVEVWNGDELVARVPLVAAEAVEEPSALGKAGWLAGETVSNLWGLLT